MSIHFWKELNIFLITFFVITFFVFLILNGGAFARDIKYALLTNSAVGSGELKDDILEVGAADAEVLAFAPGTAPMQLVIPKINVNAPVVIPRGESNKAVLASLEEGVGLYPGSAKPGDTGRAVILGHSSRASWYRGDYAYVFTLLSKLATNDEFYLVTEKNKYVYRVFANEVLTPAGANQLFAGPANGSEVNLVTCYPVGSASKRTVIRAALLRVDPV